jgi:site-specific recombinase XerD
MNRYSSPTIGYFLDTRRAKKDSGLFPLKLRVTFDRKTLLFALDAEMTEEEFDRTFKESGKRLTERLQKIKLLSDKEKQRALALADTLKPFSLARFQHAFDNKIIVESSTSETIEALFHDKMNEADLSQKSKVMYNTVLRSLVAFFEADNQKVTTQSHIGELTTPLLNRYHKYLQGKGLSRSSIMTYSRHIRAVVNIALENELITKSRYPFGKKRILVTNSDRSDRGRLSPEVIHKLLKAEFEPYSLECFARDWFLLSFFCNGMNLADFATLKNGEITDSGFRFIRQKVARTSQSDNRSIAVSFDALGEQIKAAVLSIIARQRNADTSPTAYAFPIYSPGTSEADKLTARTNFIRKINQHLPKVMKAIGHEGMKCSYGTARYSFATMLYEEGVSLVQIGMLLGQSSVKTTERYLKDLDSSPVTNAFQNAFGGKS